MPSKNKPKRLDRNNSRRVARRKANQRKLLKGSGRNRPKRPKHKNIGNEDVKTTKPTEKVKKVDKKETAKKEKTTKKEETPIKEE